MIALKELIAFLFNKTGKHELSEKEIIFSLSMDLHWFSPEDARKIIYNAINSNLLVQKEQLLIPNFDYKNLELPIDFRPTVSVLEPEIDIVTNIVETISKTKNIEKTELIREINNLQDILGVEIEISSLLIGRKYDIDISSFIEVMERKYKC